MPPICNVASPVGGMLILCATRKLTQLAEAPVSISATKLSSVGCKTPSGATGLKAPKNTARSFRARRLMRGDYFSPFAA